MNNEKMTTLSEVTNILKTRGYNLEFNLSEHYLECVENHLKIFPNDFVVDKHYRFEGPSDPGDEAIVFAISSLKHNVKGVLIDGYGISSDGISREMIIALKEKQM